MSKKVLCMFLCILFITQLFPTVSFGSENRPANRLNSPVSQTLSLDTWYIASSSQDVTTSLPKVPDGLDDSAIALLPAQPAGWLKAAVPGTVLGALCDAGTYDALFAPAPAGVKREYYADNISKIPFKDFSQPWWYSTGFEIPEGMAGKRITVTFKGINYVGEIYVNGVKLENKNINVRDESELLNTYGRDGQKLATPTDDLSPSGMPPNVINDTDYEVYKKYFKGTFRIYDLDITDLVQTGTNNIKVKVTRPMYSNQNSSSSTSDFTYFWVDWDPQPADNNMGLNSDAYISITGNLSLSNPAVSSKVDPNLDTAAVTFYVDVNNVSGGNEPITAKIKATVMSPDGASVVKTFEKSGIVVQPNAYCQEVIFDAVTFSGDELKLWWSYMSGDDPYGKRPLYTVKYEVAYDNGETVTSDTLAHRFGIREITTEVNVSAFTANNTSNVSAYHRSLQQQIYVNHKPVMLKGGGYSPDLFLRADDWRNQSVVDYVKYMGMNMIRDEGKFFDEKLLDLLDEAGILYLAGWCCCDRFEAVMYWSKAERFIAYESQYAQVRVARSHPATIMWVNGSDASAAGQNNARAVTVGARYYEILADLRFPAMGSIISSSGTRNDYLTTVGSGQRHNIGYDYQTPSFNYVAPNDGLAGFVSEGGGGPNIPVSESIRKMIPEENLWPYNTENSYNAWNYRATRQYFGTLDHFFALMENAYGGSANLEEHVMKAQVQEYDWQRLQYEVFNLRRYKSATGFVNWMLNSAWPNMMWSQFDYYMLPTGSTYGVRKGNEPVHIMYDMYNRDIYVVNSTYGSYEGYTATAQVYDLNGNPISVKMEKTIDIVEDGLSNPTPYGGNRPAITDQMVGFEKNADGTYSRIYDKYFGKVEQAYGVQQVWTNNDIEKSLTKPTTNVYFLRLELKDESGTVVSYNSYPVPMKRDVLARMNWGRAVNHQVSDMTMLDELPALALGSELKVTTGPVVIESGEKTMTLTVENTSGNIAYAVQLKAYSDAAKKDLIAPVFYSDNLFTMYPGEQRRITVSYSLSDFAGDAVIDYTCYNNVVGDTNIRSANIRGTRNLAQYSLGVRATATSTANSGVRSGNGATSSESGTSVIGTALTGNINNIITIPTSVYPSNTAYKFTYLDSTLDTAWFNADTDPNPEITVDMGKTVSFDRLTLRWNVPEGTDGAPHSMIRRPGHVVIQCKVDEADEWKTIYDADNTNASIVTNFVLDKQMEAQYFLIKPSKPRGIAPAYGRIPLEYGAVAYVQGIEQGPALTQFSLTAFEVYGFRNSVYLDIPGNGIITGNDADYTRNKTANERIITLDPNENLTLQFTPDKPGADFVVLRDGIDITDKLDADHQLVLSDVTADTIISFMSASIITDTIKTDHTTSAVVNGKDAILIVALYDESGKLITAKTETSSVNAPEWRSFSVNAQDILSSADESTFIKVFLWESGGLYIPITEAVLVN